MSRILLTWELGLNFGHLARLLPIATLLKNRGHTVLVAARDLETASRVLTPGDISFVQAPHASSPISSPQRLNGYADILLTQGWSDCELLSGLVTGWLTLFELFKPDCVVLDYSPAAGLAARFADLPALCVGNGFEIPPALNPLPPFWRMGNAEHAMRSEGLAVANANSVAVSHHGPKLLGLCDLFHPHKSMLATFPELDHYGERASANYIGPLFAGGLKAKRVDWPDKERRRIFACLRPDTSNLDTLLEGLVESEASIVCFAPGLPKDRLAKYSNPRIHFSTEFVDLKYLASDADLCISYGAEGTTISFLLAGVPQLLAPKHIEAYMAARRIEELSAGLVLGWRETKQKVLSSITKLFDEPVYKQQAKVFGSRHSAFEPARSVELVVNAVELLAG